MTATSRSASSAAETAAKPAPRAWPCAACKYTRRRCDPDCPLAPFFPQEMAAEFANARRLHGLKYLQRFVQSVAEHHRQVAFDNLIRQSSARRADPVMGIVAEVVRLRDAIAAAEAERDLLRRQILNLRHTHYPFSESSPPPIMFYLPAANYEGEDGKAMHLSLAIDEKTVDYMAAAVKQRSFFYSPTPTSPYTAHDFSVESTLTNVGNLPKLEVLSPEVEISSNP